MTMTFAFDCWCENLIENLGLNETKVLKVDDDVITDGISLY